MSLENGPIQVRNLKPFSLSGLFVCLFVCLFAFVLLLFSDWHVEGLSSLRISIKVDCNRAGKFAVCRRVRSSFSPEILQAGAGAGRAQWLEHRTRD